MERGYETVEETIYIPEGFLLLVDLEEGKIVLRKKEKEPIKGLKYKGWKLEFEGEVEEECDDNANTPKFNIGDWIVSDLEDVNEDFRLCKIIDIEGGCYTIQSANGCKGYNFFEIWESDYHLWSIADAKEGDVLVASDESLFIFARTKDIAAYYHYSLCKNGSQEISDGKHAWEVAKDCHPATKEQRELLFKKMREAGYEWDAEKKGLKLLITNGGDFDSKNCELNPVWSEEELTDFEKSLKHVMEETLECGDIHNLKADADLLLRLVKPTNGKMKETLRTEYEKGRADVIAQMQKEWSEEDENTIKVLMNIIRKSEMIDSIIYTDSLKEKLYDWLKSLKQKHTWKPSDVQMQLLKEACDEHWEPDGLDPLYMLYENLKKLKEE